MHRSTLINQLLSERRGTRFLEIGGGSDDGNLTRVRCDYKAYVDAHSDGGSDAFFAGNGDQFDVILIDGAHSEEQVTRDIAGAHRCLAPGGAIVLHDCLPPDAWYQRPSEQYVPGESWNGDVWKATLREFNRSPYRCVALPTDWGCGVIDTARPQVPARRPLPDALDYARDYPLLDEYQLTVGDFMRERVKVVYHLACLSGWAAIFVEQMLALQRHGFMPVDVTVLGDDEDQALVDALCGEHGFEIEVIFRDADVKRFETPALLAIEEYARDHEGYVLYLHAKGVSNATYENKARWRRLMMEELVEACDLRLRELPDYDAIGVNWRDMGGISHFCGNFWFASTDYLRSLADFQDYYDNPLYRISDPINDKRLGCEFWIGSGRRPANVLSLVCRNVDFCSPHFWARSGYGLAAA